MKKLTPQLLRRIVVEEMAKIQESDLTDVEAEEVDADELADTLEKPLNFTKLLKLKEAHAQLGRIIDAKIKRARR
jgi:hypothetical protein